MSRASAASALARAERDTDLGPARDRRVNARKSGKPDLRGPSARIAKRDPLASPWVPGLAALARDTMVPSDAACPFLTMSNSAVFFVPAARCCARVGLYPFAPDPKRGGRSADRRTMSVVAFARRDGSARVRRGASHDAGRSPLGAPPWRFSAGGRASISGIASGSVQRAPRSQVIMPGGRCPGPPEPAVTSRGRRTPLPAPPSGPSPEDAPP